MISNIRPKKEISVRETPLRKNFLDTLLRDVHRLGDLDKLLLKKFTTTTVEELRAVDEEIRVVQQKIRQQQTKKERTAQSSEEEKEGIIEKKTSDESITERVVYAPQITVEEAWAYKGTYELHQERHRLFLQAYLSDSALQSKHAPYQFFYQKDEQMQLPTTIVETLKYDEVEDMQRRVKYGFSFSTSKNGQEKMLYDYWIIFAHNQVLEYVLYLKA